tara:strand:+ start:2395 stop:2538 length:144 start_codon:yes stop_codon:yes gene_type:complete
MKYVASKIKKSVMADLKPVFRVPTKEVAELTLDELGEAKSGSAYPLN